MKKIKTFLFLALIIALTFVSCNSKSSTANADAKAKDIAQEMISMKAYIVEYKMVMSGEGVKSTSTMTQWIDVKNDRFVMESSSETMIGGSKQLTNSLVIDDGEWSYFVDLTTKTAMKSKSGESEDDPTEMIKSDNEQTFRQMIEKEGGKVIRNEEFLGRNCIVVEMIDEGRATKAWYYKGIPLKMTNNYYSMEATKFEENISIPSDKFKIPSDITISEMPTMPEM